MIKIERILFTGGGTLGHIYPIMPVVKELKRRNNNIKVYFIGTKAGMEASYIINSSLFDESIFLDSQGFVRAFSFKNLLTIYKHFLNYIKSRKILKRLKPEIVVGMGGYVTGAVLRAAISLKIKTAIHEQNSIYGLTNKLLKGRVDKVLLSYDIEKNEKTFLVGNPRITEIYERYKFFSTNFNDWTVLVVGGSRGADLINKITISLKDNFKRKGIKVTLITGNKYYKLNSDILSTINDDSFIVKAFVDDLPAYMLKARTIVTRCGATTIAEILALRKVCLFIPSPNVTNNHQERNASKIVEKGAGLMLKEADMDKESFFNKILELTENKELRNKIINNMNFIGELNSCYKFIEQLNGLI